MEVKFQTSNNQYVKEQLPSAMQKLADYNEKMKNSDFFNSSSRYSIELKLLNDAILEAQGLNDKNSIQVLEKRKKQVEDTLKEMTGFESQYPNSSQILANYYSTPLDSSIYSGLSELELAVLKILQKNKKNLKIPLNPQNIKTICSNMANIIPTACDRLDSQGIHFSYQAVLDIIEAGEYIISDFINTFTSIFNEQYASRAYILAQLKNNGIVTQENLEKNTGYSGSDAFTTAFNPRILNGKDCFDDILKDAGYKEDQVEIIKNIANAITKKAFLTDYFQNIVIQRLTQMSKDDVQFFIDNYKDSAKYYTPEEYLDAFNYFKNLKTPDGKSILGLGEFSSKSIGIYSEDVIEKNKNKRLYNNIKELLSIDPASVNASYIQTFLELIQTGEINPGAITEFERMSTDYKSDYKWTLSDALKKDIDVLYNTIHKNTDKTHLQAELASAYTPSVSNEAEGISSVNIGETFQVAGEKYIRIKTSNSTSQLMQISKETYYKLFPPIERFTSCQQILNDCYAIEPFMSLYSDPDTRADIVSMFKEDSDGNITVDLPKGIMPVTFKNGKLPVEQDKDLYSDGAAGFKMLEYTFGKNLVADEINKVKTSSLSSEELAEFTKFIQENGDDIFIYIDEDDGKYKWTTYSEAVSTGLYKQVGNELPFNSYSEYLLGNSGNAAHVLKTLGYDVKVYCKMYMTPYEEFKNQPEYKNISEEEYKAKMQSEIDASKKEKLLTDEDILQANGDYEWINRKVLSNEYGINIDKVLKISDFDLSLLKSDELYEKYIVQISLNHHLYSIKKGKDFSGSPVYYIFNPFNQGLPVKIYDIDTLLNSKGLITGLSLAQKKSN